MPGEPNAARVLLTGPPGSGKSRRALEAFDACLDRDGPDRALLVLPTYGEVEHQRRLAISRREERRDARAILDVSYATFTSLGERLVPGFRVRELPSRRERDLLAEEALRRAAVPSFEAVRDRPGFRSRFLRLVKEMKQTGLEPDALRARSRAALLDLGRAAPAAAERFGGFLTAWEAYDTLLASAGCLDHEDVLRGLVARARAGTTGLAGLRVLVVDGFEDLSGVEAALLQAAADVVTQAGGRVVVTLPWDPARPALFAAGASLRERLLGRHGFVEQATTGFARAAAPALVRLASTTFAEPLPGAPPLAPCALGGALRSIVGADDADEIDRIGREILRLRREEPETLPAFRHAGIVFRRLGDRGPAARRALDALGIPARIVGPGARLDAEALVRALRGPLRLLAGDDGGPERAFDAGRLLDYLRWRALASDERVPVDDVDAADLRWRTKGFPPDWETCRRDLGARGSATLRAVLDEIERLRALAVPIEGAAPAAALLEEAVRSLSTLPRAKPLDAEGRPTDPEHDRHLRRAVAARERLLSLVRDGARAAARTHVGEDATVAALVDDLLAAAADATCEPPDRRLDTVHLLDAEEARHWELGVVFVAGLAEGTFPLRPSQDVFLRDDDRETLERLGVKGGGASEGGWRTALAGETAERRLFLSSVTRARRRLYLCRAAVDDEGKDRTPSFFWNDVQAALGAPTRLDVVPDDLGRLCVVPEDAVRPRDLLRFSADRLGGPRVRGSDADRRRAQAVALWRSGGPGVAAVLRRAARFRRPEADALPPEASAAFAAVTAVFSPTDLTFARQCLHRFFLSAVADVGRDEVSFRGPSLDAPFFGRLVHRVLEQAVRQPEAGPQALAAAVIDAKAAVLTDPADRAEAEAELARIVTLFRDREAAASATGFRPSPETVEVAFGAAPSARDPGEPRVPGGDASVVSLGSGPGAFRLRGRFDRLDARAGASPSDRAAWPVILVDYKTGSGGSQDSSKAMRRLEDLQLPLYAQAAATLGLGHVVGLEHYAAKRRERFVVGDETYAGAFEVRKERGKAASVPREAFARLLDEAVAVASTVVEALRRGPEGGARGGHEKLPLDRTVCKACPVLEVCRPDVLRFPAVRAATASPLDDEDEDDE